MFSQVSVILFVGGRGVSQHALGQDTPRADIPQHALGQTSHLPGRHIPACTGANTTLTDIFQHALGQTPSLGRHIPACTGADTPPWADISQHGPGQTPPPGQTYPSMHWGRHPGRHIRACTGADHPPTTTPSPTHGHCSGWYAFYWNAFLFFFRLLPA